MSEDKASSAALFANFIKISLKVDRLVKVFENRLDVNSFVIAIVGGSSAMRPRLAKKVHGFKSIDGFVAERKRFLQIPPASTVNEVGCEIQT
jgi:hypothetical protein